MLASCGHGPVPPINQTVFSQAAENLTHAIASVRPELATLVRPAEPEPAAPEVSSEEVSRRLDGLLGGIIACMEADKGNIQVFDPASGLLHIRAQRGFSPAFLKYFDEVSPHQAACGVALQTRGTVVVSDVSTSPIFTEESRRVILQEDIRAVQSTSLENAERRRVGVVSIHYRQPGVAEQGLNLLRQFAPRLAEIVALCRPAPAAKPGPDS